TLRGFLSFAPDSEAIPLTSLNVLIGPNGSGKSNFIEALSVLRAVPRDLPLPIREGGGVKDWIWKGEPPTDQASVDAVLSEDRVAVGPAVRYRLVFGASGDQFTVLDERIENEFPDEGHEKPYFYFAYQNGRAMLNIQGVDRHLKREDIDPTQSILSQRRDPESYPEVTRVADLFRQIAIYRSWSFGPHSLLRSSCAPDVFTGQLAEDFSNLPARLAVLKRTPNVKRRIIELLHEFSPSFDDIEIVPEGGQLQLYIEESGRMVPARRLSDGTLRYLCLVAILVDPSPPPLVAIEEPELGLHPDILPIVRDMLVEASSRCQLVVSTHSTQLVDAMTDYTNAVLVSEKREDSTRLTRLSQEEINRWREHGSLGSLWMSGHLGGTRW
ncbi:MAG: AAA family ATPase, partial [Deltaproteobacteria bacterium]|nr:AAA family ATPase [Deltaproteobacteria bacterium]